MLIAIELKVIMVSSNVDSVGKGHAAMRMMAWTSAMLYGGFEIADQISFGTHSESTLNNMKSSW